MAQRRDSDGTPLCNFTVGRGKCFGLVLGGNWGGFCVRHALHNRGDFQNAFRLIKRGWLDKWHSKIGDPPPPERPQCKRMVYQGKDRKRCHYKIHEGFDDGYCHLHGPD